MEYRGPINSTKLLISRSENFTQILAFSSILDLKDSTVSLRCRPSGEKLVFLTVFVNKRHTFLASFAVNNELLDIFNHI